MADPFVDRLHFVKGQVLLDRIGMLELGPSTQCANPAVPVNCPIRPQNRFCGARISRSQYPPRVSRRYDFARRF
jgi:hypothetical protein